VTGAGSLGAAAAGSGAKAGVSFFADGCWLKIAMVVRTPLQGSPSVDRNAILNL
jgi:hypothetical protein